jgi:hypothetical protein
VKWLQAKFALPCWAAGCLGLLFHQVGSGCSVLLLVGGQQLQLPGGDVGMQHVVHGDGALLHGTAHASKQIASAQQPGRALVWSCRMSTALLLALSRRV